MSPFDFPPAFGLQTQNNNAESYYEKRYCNVAAVDEFGLSVIVSPEYYINLDNVIKVLSWIPPIGIIVGLSRDICNNESPSNFSEKCLYVFRACMEILCLGPLLALIDISITIWRECNPIQEVKLL